MTVSTLYLGEIWHTPSAEGSVATLEAVPQGAIAVDPQGRITDVGKAADVRKKHPGATIVDYGEQWMLPGFVDAHVHFPQIDMIGAQGHSLLGWLERYTFPTEARFADRLVAEAAATRFVSELLHNGTTLAAIYASSHRASATALFEECDRRGIRAIIGKVSMDCDAPEALLHDVAEDVRDNIALIEKWHGHDGRLFAALTPRFALSCSESMLAAIAKLRKVYPTVYVQTHFAECTDELAEVKRRFPKDRDYLSVYDRFGLLGERTILGHGIHASDAEVERLASSRSVVAHCPSSNLFLGSGLFSMERMTNAGVRIALGTDVGGGTSYSLLRTMDEAYKVQRLQGRTTSPATLLYLATLGGARALGMGDVTGSFAPGKDADFQILDWRRSRLLAARSDASADERLAALATIGDDRLLRAVYVRGRPVLSEPAVGHV